MGLRVVAASLVATNQPASDQNQLSSPTSSGPKFSRQPTNSNQPFSLDLNTPTRQQVSATDDNNSTPRAFPAYQQQSSQARADFSTNSPIQMNCYMNMSPDKRDSFHNSDPIKPHNNHNNNHNQHNLQSRQYSQLVYTQNQPPVQFEPTRVPSPFDSRVECANNGEQPASSVASSLQSSRTDCNRVGSSPSSNSAENINNTSDNQFSQSEALDCLSMRAQNFADQHNQFHSHPAMELMRRRQTSLEAHGHQESTISCGFHHDSNLVAYNNGCNESAANNWAGLASGNNCTDRPIYSSDPSATMRFDLEDHQPANALYGPIKMSPPGDNSSSQQLSVSNDYNNNRQYMSSVSNTNSSEQQHMQHMDCSNNYSSLVPVQTSLDQYNNHQDTSYANSVNGNYYATQQDHHSMQYTNNESNSSYHQFSNLGLQHYRQDASFESNQEQFSQPVHLNDHQRQQQLSPTTNTNQSSYINGLNRFEPASINHHQQSSYLHVSPESKTSPRLVDNLGHRRDSIECENFAISTISTTNHELAQQQSTARMVVGGEQSAVAAPPPFKGRRGRPRKKGWRSKSEYNTCKTRY